MIVNNHLHCPVCESVMEVRFSERYAMGTAALYYLHCGKVFKKIAYDSASIDSFERHMGDFLADPIAVAEFKPWQAKNNLISGK